MAKLIQMLAASVGGGLVLGASIRLGEAISSSARRPVRERERRFRGFASSDAMLAERLTRLEEKMGGKFARQAETRESVPAREWQGAISEVVARMDRQQTEVESIRRQMGNTTRAMDSISSIADHLRSDLQQQIGEDLDRRLASVEEKLHLSMKAANRETVNAMVASIESRVAPRISRLESEIGEQSNAISELRECSMQSERNILRLVSALEKTLNTKVRAAEGEQTQESESGDSRKPDLSRLSVMPNREQGDAGDATLLRPASFR